LVSVHRTVTGELKTTTYNRAYNPNLNTILNVPVSANRLAPDYAGTTYIHPANRGRTIRIPLSGSRSTDNTLARAMLGDPVDESLYTWHHLDDFEIIDGQAYATMQLVEKIAHGGPGVSGMQHSGAAAQWKAYFGTDYR